MCSIACAWSCGHAQKLADRYKARRQGPTLRLKRSGCRRTFAKLMLTLVGLSYTT